MSIKRNKTEQKEARETIYLSPGEWLWLDKTVMDYTNWDEGQPSDYSHGGISTSDGTWKAGHQRFDRPYICKTPKGKIILLMWIQFES